MAAKKKQKQISGSAKMYALGKKPIMLWVTPEQLDKLRKAAAIEMRYVTQFISFYAMKAADALIAKSDG